MLPFDVLGYIMSYIDNKTLLLIYDISHKFAELSRVNLRATLRNNLYQTTKFDVRNYDMKRLVKLSKFTFEPSNIATFDKHALILTNTGLIYSYGKNKWGQLGLGLGLGNIINRITPTLIPNFNNIVAVKTGYKHSLLLTNTGQIYSCGNNDLGQLGLGYTNDKFIFTLIPNLRNIVKIASSYEHSLCLTEDGQVYSFGGNSFGQLGLGHGDIINIPTLIPKYDNVIHIITGSFCSFIITVAGKIYAFGNNSAGRLGLGDSRNAFVPVLIKDLDNIINVTNSVNTSIFLTNDYRIYGSGRKFMSLTPILIQLNISPIKIVHTRNHYLALDQNEQLYTFICDYKSITAKKQNITLSNVNQITGSRWHTFIIDNHHKIYAWNEYVQLDVKKAIININNLELIMSIN